MIYLSGKITDVSKEKERENLEVFNKKAKELRAKGLEVFNPAELEEPGGTWERYLARDLRFIFENKPKLYVLKGWETSRGARLEVEVARELGLAVEYE